MPYASPFTLDAPLAPLAPSAGGTGKLPPTSDPRPFARPSGAGNGATPAPRQNNKPSVIPAPVVASSYPKPRAWVEKRIALATRHHAAFKAWRKAESAKLAAWVTSQPGYDPSRAAQEAYVSQIRIAFRNRR